MLDLLRLLVGKFRDLGNTVAEVLFLTLVRSYS